MPLPSLTKCIVTCKIHYYNITLQNIFTALKILCAPPLQRSPIGFQLYLKVLQHTLANIFRAPAVSLWRLSFQCMWKQMFPAGTGILFESFLLAYVRAIRTCQGITVPVIVLISDKKEVEDKCSCLLSLQWDNSGMQSTLYPSCTQGD